MRRLAFAIAIALIAVAVWISGAYVGMPGAAQRRASRPLATRNAPLTHSAGSHKPQPRSTVAPADLPQSRQATTRKATATATIDQHGARRQPGVKVDTGHSTTGPGPATSIHQPSGDRQPSVIVDIPRLGVRAPVYDRGVDSTGTPAIAPGYSLTHLRYSGALGKPGNYVLYGHDDIEGNILQFESTLSSGDYIELRQGASGYIYQVVATKIVAGSDISVLDQTAGPTLTMISCYPVGVDSERIVVLASLVEVDAYASART